MMVLCAWLPFLVQVCWAAEHTLATASGKDSIVRMYNFETEDNYILQVCRPAILIAHAQL